MTMAVSAGGAKRLAPRRRTADERPQDAHHGAANDVGVDQGKDREARDGIFAEAGGEQRIADNGEGGDRREFENEARHDERRPADRSSQPSQPADVQRRGHVCAGLDRPGRTGFMGRARIERRQRPAQGELRKPLRQERERGDRRGAPKEAQQELLRNGIARRVGEPSPEQGELRHRARIVCEFGGHFPKPA